MWFKKCKQQNYENVCLEKYGVKNVSSNKDIQNKKEQTKLEHYGDKNYNNREKCKQTSLKHFGTEHPLQSDEIKQKIRETNLEKYGETSYAKTYMFAQQKRYKIYVDEIGFDSQLEVDLYNWCNQNNISIKVHPESIIYIDSNDIKHSYHPDFIINNNLVECKGKHFLIYDSDNKIIGLKNPFTSKLTNDELYKDKCKQEAKFKCMLDNNVIIITDISEFDKLKMI